MASLEESIAKGRKSITTEYITGKPDYPQNYEYMNFFNSYFKNFLYSLSQKKEGQPINKLINEINYEGLMEFLATDARLKNDTLREGVIIKGLYEIYRMQEYRQEKIFSIFEIIAKKGKSVAHRQIAGNILNEFNRLIYGSKAPQFILPDVNGKQISLASFKGKFVYLCFWATWCSSCLSEIKLLQSIKTEMDNEVKFVCIATDAEVAPLAAFIKKNPKYNLTFLHMGTNTKIKDDYAVKSVPLFVFINPEGKIVNASAPKPSQNLKGYFKKTIGK